MQTSHSNFGFCFLFQTGQIAFCLGGFYIDFNIMKKVALMEIKMNLNNEKKKAIKSKKSIQLPFIAFATQC
jgi:hypothetical protein